MDAVHQHIEAMTAFLLQRLPFMASDWFWRLFWVAVVLVIIAVLAPTVIGWRQQNRKPPDDSTGNPRRSDM
jgi:hypothetical protein